MRVLCALHPHLGLVAALRHHPDLHGEAIIVGGAPELRLPVVAASPVARAAGLSVVPLQEEQYDFAVPPARWDRPAVVAFRRLLERDDVRRGLEALGFRV